MLGRGGSIAIKVDGVLMGTVCHICDFNYVLYGCRLCGVGFHMCVVKFQDVGYEVLN